MTASVLALLVHLVPPWQHAWTGEDADTTYARYVAFAHIIADVVEDKGPLPSLNAEQSALVLASLAARESYMRADIMTCKRNGLGGAVGPYQVETRRWKARACASWRDATEQAHELVSESMRQCAHSPLPDRLAWYTDGHRVGCPSPWPRSRSRMMPALRFRPSNGGTI